LSGNGNRIVFTDGEKESPDVERMTRTIWTALDSPSAPACASALAIVLLSFFRRSEDTTINEAAAIAAQFFAGLDFDTEIRTN
jgi:hypothetical protein